MQHAQGHPNRGAALGRGFASRSAEAVCAFASGLLGRDIAMLGQMEEADALDVGRGLQAMQRLIEAKGYPASAVAGLLEWLAAEPSRLAALFSDADRADALQAEWMAANPPPDGGLFDQHANRPRKHQDPA
ncbi:MAG: hypothetical protein IAE99_08050 [Rhodothermales bacterium]|nr:hypothetical protein [Rhodothermales bacterium]